MIKTKRFVGTVMAGVIALTFVGCGTNDVAEKADEVQEQTVTDAESPVADSEDELTEEEGTSVEKAALPAYQYPGPELFYSVLYQYIIDEFGPQYDAADVGIPCPIIVHEDESNKEDIKVYGDFWYLNYDLNGDVLECTSGGSYPGCIHIKSTDEGYEVIGMDLVEDGSNYDSSAKKIFGDYYEDFSKATADTDSREEIRAQIIANYVFANDLDIKSYKDYGWDPVDLPEQNIDSFYSTLN